MMLSTPVCGVAMRKLVQAPWLAPSLRSPTVVGITPQEHRGSGTPMAAAFTTLFMLFGAKCLAYSERGTNTRSSPAIRKPSNR